MVDANLQTILAYHQRSKHQLARYAAGPETLDWDMQPNPFRRFAGSRNEGLPLVADTLRTPWAELFVAGHCTPRSFNRSHLGALLELSFGLSAWKQYGPDRWALRCNPSSGNLHPTEAYVLAHGVMALDDGLYHYAPREHVLELRATLNRGHGNALPQERPHLWVALSSVHWREAWKYGERAFRYCQLDVGHAIGALRYAAALLGWHARVIDTSTPALARLIGTDRVLDFANIEQEEAELLIEIFPQGAGLMAPLDWTAQGVWSGRANCLDPSRHMYHWPIIDQVAAASRRLRPASDRPRDAAPRMAGERAHTALAATQPASTLIRQRRSAQHFERRASMPAAHFFAIARSLLSDTLPWDVWLHDERIHPVFFVHRVDGLASGAWVLPRSRRGEHLLRSALAPDMLWQALNPAVTDLPLFMLADNPGLAGSLRTLCCHQAIGADACFAVAMLADFSATLHEDPADYRRLYQEAGLLGQVLYMEAEAHGLRGTGIGCYFDDGLHDLLGIHDTRLQSLYHFTVGVPLVDNRITTEAPYPGRVAEESSP
ncbi:MAG TPA: SagB family peptide dehydrogenase [Rhodocyclaceae bacterium]|nr:SagB family peptide dehydrogenase [Rhodocyclaceae bacterium]